MSDAQMAGAPLPKPGANANVRYGAYGGVKPTLVGKTIAEARKMYAGEYKMPADATAYCDKVALDDNYVIQDGDTITFLKRAGEKG